MLRGNALAKVDEKGRLKMPSVFRSIIEPRYGREFFVTSILGDHVRVYPMEVYAEYETRMGQASQVGPLVNRLRDALNYYGQTTTMDGQGRILIHPLLREKAGIDGEEVTVLGQHDRLVVWNRRTFEERLEKNPLTENDLHGLEALGF
jgi:MraZ protein